MTGCAAAAAPASSSGTRLLTNADICARLLEPPNHDLAAVIQLEISKRNARVLALQHGWDRMRAGFDQILQERGKELAGECGGGSTGIIVRDYKRRNADQPVYKIDPGVVLMAAERRTAQPEYTMAKHPKPFTWLAQPTGRRRKCGRRRSYGSFLPPFGGSFPLSLHRRFISNGFLRSSLASGCLLGLGCPGSFGSDLGPAFLRGLDDGFSASGTELALRLGGLGSGRPRSLLGLSPSLPLGCGNSLSSGGAHLLPSGLGGFRSGGRFRPTTVQHLPKFGYLNVYALLLGFEARDGGSDDFVVNLVCGHFNRVCRFYPFT